MMKLQRLEGAIVFLLVFIFAISIAYFINFRLNFIFGDALTRSFRAYLVLFGNEPKLTSIGFVWPPLPTILQIPLVLVKPLNTYGFAGNILTAIFLGVTAVYFNKIMRLFELKSILRGIFLTLFITNPMIIFYGSNGMSEMVFIGFTIISIYYFLSFIKEKHLTSLILSSFSLSFAIMSRWEAFALLPTILFSIGYIHFLIKKQPLRRAEGLLLMYLTPIIFVSFVWLLANWVIVGSPFYFLHNPYSNATEASKLLANSSLFYSLKGNLLLDVFYVAKMVGFTAPFFIISLIAILLKTIDKIDRLHSITLLGFSISIILFHVGLLYLGQSFGYLRFFIYTIPFYFILSSYILSKQLILHLKGKVRVLSISILLFLLILSSFITVFGMSLPTIGQQEHIFIEALRGGRNDSQYYNYKEEKQVATYLSENITGREILIDDSVGFSIIYLSQKPHLFIETVDSDFESVLANPVGTRKAKYLLVRNPKNSDNLDILSVKYPGIFENGTNFTILDKDFGDWRLYKIIE